MGNLPESVKVGTDMITSTSNAQIKNHTAEYKKERHVEIRVPLLSRSKMFFRSSLRLDRRGLSCREFFRKISGIEKRRV